MKAFDHSPRSIVFGEDTIVDGYSFLPTEKRGHHWRRENKGAAVEFLEDRCWKSVHSNDFQELMDDLGGRRVFGNGYQEKIRLSLQPKFPPRVLPGSSFARVLGNAYRSLARTSTGFDGQSRFKILLNHRFISVFRDGEPMRRDLQRRIVIRVYRGGQEKDFMDYPIRSTKPFWAIDWMRAFDISSCSADKHFSIAAVRRGFPTKSDLMDIVFDGGVGAIALHEACGHLVESDLNILGSSGPIRLGDKVAGDFVTLVDNPTIPGALGSYSVDDEGNAAGATTIIERGRLKRLLSSMRYSRADDKDASANGRRSSYRNIAFPRMSNLILVQGRASRSEIIKSVSRGILVKAIGVGGENYPGLGSFAISVRDGRFITNGKVGEGTGRLMIQGLSADFLRKIASVGQKPAFKPLATLCEKHQQRLYTDGIAPPFLVRSLNVLWGENE